MSKPKNLVNVLLDTNFLLLPFEFKLDVFSAIKYHINAPVQFIVSETSIKELKGLSKNKNKFGLFAKSALSYIDKNPNYFKILKEDSDAYADNWIYSYAIKHKTYVATNDKALRMKLRKKGISVFVLRNRSQIELV